MLPQMANIFFLIVISANFVFFDFIIKLVKLQ